jgi:hypothetical protein
MFSFSFELLFGALKRKALMLTLRDWVILTLYIRELGECLLQLSLATKIGDSAGERHSCSDCCSASWPLVKQTPIEEGSLVVSRPSNQEGGDRSEVDEGNMIGVAFFDLGEADQCWIREEMRRVLEEIEAIKMREKLACYLKPRGGVVRKADTTKASTSKVSGTTRTT